MLRHAVFLCFNLQLIIAYCNTYLVAGMFIPGNPLKGHTCPEWEHPAGAGTPIIAPCGDTGD